MTSRLCLPVATTLIVGRLVVPLLGIWTPSCTGYGTDSVNRSGSLSSRRWYYNNPTMSPHPTQSGGGSRRGFTPGTLGDTRYWWRRRCALVPSNSLPPAGRRQKSTGLIRTIAWCSKGICRRKFSGLPSEIWGACCSLRSTAQKWGIGWWRCCAPNILTHTPCQRTA